MTLNRRQFVSAATYGPLAVSALALHEHALAQTHSARNAESASFDPSNMRESTKAFLKLTGSLGTEVVRKWFTGKIYAFLPGEPIRELFYLDGFYLEQYEALPDGTHRSTRYEITIKRDLETGGLLESWVNPYTGRVDTVENSVGGPQYKVYNDWGFERPSRVRGPGNTSDLEWTIVGDNAWVTWDLFLRFPHPLQPDEHPLASSGPRLDLVNLTNYMGSLSDIENTRVLNAPGIMFWNAVSGWSPWMEMAQRPGTLIYKAVGVKVPRFSDVPEKVFAATERAFPGHLDEDVPWQEGSYSWFDRSDKTWDELVD